MKQEIGLHVPQSFSGRTRHLAVLQHDQFGWGPQSDKDTTATVQRAMEVGVNWIDCAPIYGRGQSEEAVGRALKTLSKSRLLPPRRYSNGNRTACRNSASTGKACVNNMK